MVQYRVVSDSFPSPTDVVSISDPKQVRDQTNGEIVSDVIDIMLTFVNLDGETDTVPFTCDPNDEMDYGRQMYHDIMGGKVAGLSAIAEADPWIGPPPEPEPDPRDKQIANLEAKVQRLETFVDNLPRGLTHRGH